MDRMLADEMEALSLAGARLHRSDPSSTKTRVTSNGPLLATPVRHGSQFAPVRGTLSGESMSIESSGSNPDPAAKFLIPTTFRSVQHALSSCARNNTLNNGSRLLPTGWAGHVHFDGRSYFYMPRMRLVTTNDICNPAALNSLLETWRETMAEIEEDRQKVLPNDWELCLYGGNSSSDDDSDEEDEMHDEEDGYGLVHRFVSHEHHIIFHSDTDGPLRISNDSFTGYWGHLMEFPMHLQEVPPKAEAHFQETMRRAMNGTFDHGTQCPVPRHELERVTEIYNGLKSSSNDLYNSRGRVAALVLHIAEVTWNVEMMWKLGDRF